MFNGAPILLDLQFTSIGKKFSVYLHDDDEAFAVFSTEQNIDLLEAVPYSNQVEHLNFVQLCPFEWYTFHDVPNGHTNLFVHMLLNRKTSYFYLTAKKERIKNNPSLQPCQLTVEFEATCLMAFE